VLPVLEAELGPGVAEALARTASALRADADALDELAAAAAQRIADGEPGLPADALATLPGAIRSRVLRGAALAAGAPAARARAGHIAQLDALVMSWHGQQGADLPGGVRCQRRCGRLLFSTAAGRPNAASRKPSTTGAIGGTGWTRLTWEPISRRS